MSTSKGEVIKNTARRRRKPRYWKIKNQLPECWVEIETIPQRVLPRLGTQYQATNIPLLLDIKPQPSIDELITHEEIETYKYLEWTEIEKDTFENALLDTTQKNFTFIQTLIPTKTYSQIIEYYYLWKYSSRYKNFKTNLEMINKRNNIYFDITIDAQIDWLKVKNPSKLKQFLHLNTSSTNNQLITSSIQESTLSTIQESTSPLFILPTLKSIQEPTLIQEPTSIQEPIQQSSILQESLLSNSSATLSQKSMQFFSTSLDITSSDTTSLNIPSFSETSLFEIPLSETSLSETPLFETSLSETPLSETPLSEISLSTASLSTTPLSMLSETPLSMSSFNQPVLLDDLDNLTNKDFFFFCSDSEKELSSDDDAFCIVHRRKRHKSNHANNENANKPTPKL